MFFPNTFFRKLNVTFSLPISLLDRSYPFYAERGITFGLSLLLLNACIQTTIIIMILKIITNYRKSNSL